MIAKILLDVGLETAALVRVALQVLISAVFYFVDFVEDSGEKIAPATFSNLSNNLQEVMKTFELVKFERFFMIKKLFLLGSDEYHKKKEFKYLILHPQLINNIPMLKKVMKDIVLTLLFLFFILNLNAQIENSEIFLANKIEKFKIKPVIALQLWSTYTFGMEVFSTDTGNYEKVDNRLNTHIRRSRLGIKGQPYKNLKFNFTSALDLVGKDLLAGTQGGGNNGGSPAFRLWTSIIQWKILDDNDGLHLTAGYFTPLIGRESITSAFRVSSMEKSWSQNYLRRQLVGTGPGRALGINIGGLFFKEGKQFGWGYDIGIFNPVFHSFSGNSVGKEFAVLLVGRAVLYIGEPESKTYTRSYKTNYFGKRKGLSIALSGASQGTTELFDSHQALGFDWLLNWKNFNFDGDWTLLYKSGNALQESFRVKSNTGYVRISYNFEMSNGHFLEPAFMVSQFNGALDAIEQSRATMVKAFAGKDASFIIGINYHFNPNLKLSLHHTWRKANAGDAVDGATFNNYFFQGGVGAIRRGDWLGIGLVAIF